MSDELKPCPFCGHGRRVSILRGTGGEISFEVGCEGGCGMHSYHLLNEEERDEQIRIWNTRPVEDALRAELVELRAKWASVPWDDINVALFEVFHDGDCHCDHCGRLNNAIATAEDWYDANKPKEPTE